MLLWRQRLRVSALAVAPARVGAPARAVVVGALLVLAASSAQLSAPRPALASDGYHETATTTYTVNPAARRLDVAIDIAFKNTTTSTSTTYFYYDVVYVTLEHEATRVDVADQAGDSIVRDKVGRTFDRWAIHLGRAIYYGETRHLHVTYQLPAGAPRSGSSIRINPAFASFCVIAMGDDGGTARVVAPSGYAFEVDGEGGSLFPTTTGTTTTWSSGALADPYAFWACLSGPDASGFTDTVLTSPSGQEIDVQAWPDDGLWQSEVKDEVDTTLATLESIVGRGLPRGEPIVVREVAGTELAGYAGLYNPSTGVAVVGEQYGNDGTVAHELSHAWFNDNLFELRWQSEGMAEWARISVVPDTCPAPGQPAGGSADLQHWVFSGPRSTKAETDAVDYEYRAACYVVATLAGMAGPDGMRAALAAIFDRKLAYQSGGVVLDGSHEPVSWRSWLDAIDELGLVPAGKTDLDFAQNLLRTYGAGPTSVELENRSNARASYHQLAGSIGDWTLPEAVLRPMGEWDFGAATVAIADTSTTFSTLQQADAALEGIAAVDGPVKALVEAAKTDADLKAASQKAGDELAAAKAVADAQARLDAPRDVLTQIGLLGSDPATALPAAKSAAAAADLPGATTQAALITTTLAGASQQGLARVAIAVVVTLLVLLLLTLVTRRRRQAGARRRLALASAHAGDAATTDVPASDVWSEPTDESVPASDERHGGESSTPGT